MVNDDTHCLPLNLYSCVLHTRKWAIKLIQERDDMAKFSFAGYLANLDTL